MKTKFSIEIETKDMNRVSCEDEDMYEGKKMGDDITEEIEKDLHKEIKETVRHLEDKESELYKKFSSLISEDSDMAIEGFETLDDYGKILIKVI